MTVTGLRTVVRTFNVTAGQTVLLNLTGLPLGLDSFLAEAFDGACSALTNTSVPTWISDPVSANVGATVAPQVTLVLRRNGRASACIDWQDDSAPPVRLTSITLDPEDATGATTNAPGAWSTSTGDPLSQILVIENGAYQNQGAATGGLGEIDVPLTAGVHTLMIVGNGLFAGNGYYGAVLFFDGHATPPDAAVYNANNGTGAFSVQPAGTTIMSNANGGHFFDPAPGTATYTAANGTKVTVLSYTINATTSSTDLVSGGQIWANGVNDTVANLVLSVAPACP
jgi:hypothetical protein